MASHEHVPVMLEEVTSYLEPHPGGRFIDATLGGTGHAKRILEMTGPEGRLLGIDADRQAIDSARVSLQAFAGRVTLVHSYFDGIGRIAASENFGAANGILFDLGMSSSQLDEPTRGFSFQQSGPLDMRMSSDSPKTAAEIIALSTQGELTRVFKEYGEERYASRISRRIVSERARQAIETTDQLASLIVRTIPWRRGGIHPATRVFQALRIAVNDELARLSLALPQSLSLLQRGGRLVVISFHSLEDRIVKQFMQTAARGCICPPDIPQCVCGKEPTLRILTGKPVRPTPFEMKSNPRSRSAKLRAAEAT